MTAIDDYGPWFDHDGLGTPVADGTMVIVIVEGRPGQTYRLGPMVAQSGVCPCGCGHQRDEAWDWRNWLTQLSPNVIVGRVLRYRVRRSPAMRDLVAMVEHLPVAADLPITAKEGARS